MKDISCISTDLMSLGSALALHQPQRVVRVSRADLNHSAAFELVNDKLLENASCVCIDASSALVQANDRRSPQ